MKLAFFHYWVPALWIWRFYNVILTQIWIRNWLWKYLASSFISPHISARKSIMFDFWGWRTKDAFTALNLFSSFSIPCLNSISCLQYILHSVCCFIPSNWYGSLAVAANPEVLLWNHRSCKYLKIAKYNHRLTSWAQKCQLHITCWSHKTVCGKQNPRQRHHVVKLQIWTHAT